MHEQNNATDLRNRRAESGRTIARWRAIGTLSPASGGLIGSTVQRGARWPWVKLALCTGLVLVPVEYCRPQPVPSPDIYTLEAEKSPRVDFYYQEKSKQAASARQEQFRRRVSIRDAVGENVPLAFPKNSAAAETRTVAPPQSDSLGIVRHGILLLTVSLLSAILFIRLLAPGFFKAVFKKLNPLAKSGTETSSAAKVRAEDEAFGEFLASFQAGPGIAPATGAAEATGQRVAVAEVPEFCTKAARLLATQRSLLQDISRSTEEPARRRMLADLGREINAFKGEAGAPGSLPAWQLASALEGLLKQLTDKSGNVTRSTLRTVGGAVDLLEKLCRPGVREDLLTHPPVRFLAVDDDMICRTALSLALKKAFNQPDLAENGATALGLANKNTYDVIFLDVQMQGMDGFELCSKIHETSTNKETPVVFVTCMSDFDARAQSILSGGSDLLGKPFLTFEVTVKALTLALGRRLEAGTKPVTECDTVENARMLAPDPVAQTDSVTTNLAPTTTGVVTSAPEQSDENTDRLSQAMSANRQVADKSGESSDNLEHAFLTRASTHLESLRERVRQLTEATDQTTRQDTLADLYLWHHALTPGLEATPSHPAMRLSMAFEALLKKLLEDPQHWTASALLTIVNAMDLLDDLCAPGVNPDLAANPPIHILVVDDDLLSRRAMVCALQMAFEKPECVEDGPAALALATEKAFDLIFMDVQMPGMDGFTACAKIRQTSTNGTTPVVFVTGHADLNARSQAASSGGNGLIAKPFLISEITLKALTFALRGRLQRNPPTNRPPSAPEPPEDNPPRESRRARKRRLARLAVT